MTQWNCYLFDSLVLTANRQDCAEVIIIVNVTVKQDPISVWASKGMLAWTLSPWKHGNVLAIATLIGMSRATKFNACADAQPQQFVQHCRFCSRCTRKPCVALEIALDDLIRTTQLQIVSNGGQSDSFRWRMTKVFLNLLTLLSSLTQRKRKGIHMPFVSL